MGVITPGGNGGGAGGTVDQGSTPWVVDQATTLTVDGTVTAAGPLTNAELRASGIVVTGPLTDTQLRAAAVAISAAALPLPAGAAKDSTLTDGTQRVGGTVGVSGPLTDAQLRATRVPVDGSGVTQPVSAASLPLPATAAKDATLTDGTQRVGGTLDVSDRAARLAGVVSGTVGVNNFPATQPISAASLPLPATAAKDSTLTDSSQRIGGTVAMTQSTSPWKAREDTAAMTWVSLKSAAPAASAVQADTGALAAGDYDFDIYLLASDTVAVGKGLVVEHRNAANGTTLQTIGGIDAPDSLYFPIRRYTMAANERLRIIAGTAAGAASSMYVSAIGRRVS